MNKAYRVVICNSKGRVIRRELDPLFCSVDLAKRHRNYLVENSVHPINIMVVEVPIIANADEIQTYLK